MEQKSKFDNITISVPQKEGGNDAGTSDFDILPMEKQASIRFGQDTKHRKWLVCWMMLIVSIWLISVLLITAFNRPWCLHIDEKVLMTLLATTTINVLGLANIILDGLFGDQDHKSIRKFFNKQRRK